MLKDSNSVKGRKKLRGGVVSCAIAAATIAISNGFILGNESKAMKKNVGSGTVGGPSGRGYGLLGMAGMSGTGTGGSGVRLQRSGGSGSTGNGSPGGNLPKNGGLGSKGNGSPGGNLQRSGGSGSTGNVSGGGSGIDVDSGIGTPISKVGPDPEEILGTSYTLIYQKGF